MISLGVTIQAHVIDVCLHLSPGGKQFLYKGVWVSGYIGPATTDPRTAEGKNPTPETTGTTRTTSRQTPATSGTPETANHPNAGGAQHQHQQHPRHQTTTRHANHHRDTLTVGNTNAANTHSNINTTTNPTNNVPRCRHLQHPYHHHHDPGTE